MTGRSSARDAGGAAADAGRHADRGGQHAELPAALARTRVGGLVARLTEVLNIDGYEVLIHDEGAKQVRLQRELLVQGFGL